MEALFWPASPYRLRRAKACAFLLTAEDAAGRIVTGLRRRKFEIVFPWQMTWMLKAARLMPYPLYFSIVRRSAAARRQD